MQTANVYEYRKEMQEGLLKAARARLEYKDGFCSKSLPECDGVIQIYLVPASPSNLGPGGNTRDIIELRGWIGRGGKRIRRRLFVDDFPKKDDNDITLQLRWRSQKIAKILEKFQEIRILLQGRAQIADAQNQRMRDVAGELMRRYGCESVIPKGVLWILNYKHIRVTVAHRDGELAEIVSIKTARPEVMATPEKLKKLDEEIGK